ncbi:uncharacterized protein [Rutidosis leptorrhynchoides]|uniref:uncharacterized protein n=1 Tax=Rutidosis leptorrhynchoides TaxID=125765 RepID=UPI003A99D17D
MAKCGVDLSKDNRDAIGISGGMLVVWDTSSFLVESAGGNEYFLAIQGKWVSSGHETLIANVYGPHNDEEKKLMWGSLDDLISKIDPTWVVCGDFNEVRCHSNILNCVFHPSRASRFNEFIARNNLIEIPINGKRFTRISDDGTKFSKLVRFLVNDKFISFWVDLSVVPLDCRDSDHCPLLLRDRVIDFGPKPFKIFDEWFKKDGVDKVILEAWNKSADHDGNNGPEHLSSLRPNHSDHVAPVGPTVTASDGPTGTVGPTITDSVRGPAESMGFDVHKLSVDEAGALEEKFSESEIWEAVKGCGSSKAPGLDRFNMGFYKKFWYVIKDDLVESINLFWETRDISKGYNTSFITLVPKKADPLCLNDYHLISLIGSYYKVIAKLLSNRLKKWCPILLVLSKVRLLKEEIFWMVHLLQMKQSPS